MSIDRLSITMDAALGAAARKAAKRANLSVSAWLAEAAAERLRHEALGGALTAWQSEDGAFTAPELDAAAEALGAATRPTRPPARRRSSR